MADKRNTPRKARKTNAREQTTNYAPLAIVLALLLVAVVAFFLGAAAQASSTPAPAPAAVDENIVVCNIGCPLVVEEEIVEEIDILVFGRLDDTAAKKYFMGLAAIDPELLRAGTPLQQYHDQLTDESYDGLKLSPKLEDLNDALKFVIVGDKVFKVPQTGYVAIDSVSWTRYIEGKGLLICRDDTGNPGTWYGDCGDENATLVTDWVSLESFLASSDGQPWASQITDLIEDFDGISNGRIEVFTTYR